MLADRLPNGALFWKDLETFIESPEPAEREAFNLRRAGKTQTEIADIADYKPHCKHLTL